MCINVCISTGDCRGRLPLAGVMGDCEVPSVGAGNWTHVLYKKAHMINCLAVFQAMYRKISI